MKTVAAESDTCSNIPMDMENLCPNIFSEKTGSYVRSIPKYVPRDHPQYDVMVPEAARGKTNLYCAHPELVCPGLNSSSSDSCYLFRQDRQTWEAARDKCDGLRGHLITIETADELSSIEEVVHGYVGWVWTGLNDRSSEGVYTWEKVGGTVSNSSSWWHDGYCVETAFAGSDTCSNVPMEMENLCPNIFSEKTGSYVRSIPKYVPRDHPQYDVMVPAEARGKTNLYCAHPELLCPSPDLSSPDSCYLYRQDSQPWEVARDSCDELGGYLVAIETPSEFSRIVEVLLISNPGSSYFYAWTGLNDRSSEGVYTWERVGGTLPTYSSLWYIDRPDPNNAEIQDCIGARLEYGYCVETAFAESDTCSNVPMEMENLCPYIFSEKTGSYVRSTPKYVPRHHPQYDVMVPEAARGKTNLYCAHPGYCVETAFAGSDTCSNVPMEMENLCPNIFSEKTGSYVRSIPKYVPRDHPQYDVMVPAEARGKTNLYCAHPELLCPGPDSSPQDSCYLYRREFVTWEVARDRCDEVGGYLVAIETPSELSSITDVLLISNPESSYIYTWTGLNDRSSEGVYTWDRVGGTLPTSSKLLCSGPDLSSPDSCYLYRQDSQPWEVARDRCDELGGYLVAIETPSEFSRIVEKKFILRCPKRHYGHPAI
ncbi:macrophage mannose receptor 1-like [Diadema antillarum]|uniref:macrophage mannose receptor 1-like n=1 Tax=Diadema antillarum TaxID=105358 RepID=UPI003A836F03